MGSRNAAKRDRKSPMREFHYIARNKLEVFYSAIGIWIGQLIVKHDRFHFGTWNQASDSLVLAGKTALGTFLGIAFVVLVIQAVQFSLNDEVERMRRKWGFDAYRN
jgi:hypothetical protein